MSVAATTQELLKLADTIVNFCETHFASEEQFLRDCRYPGFDEHAEKHKGMLSQVCDIRTAISAGNQEAVTDCAKLINSFHDHITRFDRPAYKWAAGIATFRTHSIPEHFVKHICHVESATEDLIHPDFAGKLTGCLYCDQPFDDVPKAPNTTPVPQP